MDRKYTRKQIEEVMQYQINATANRNALYVLKNALDEGGENGDIIAKGEHTLVMRGPGSHVFTFAEFD